MGRRDIPWVLGGILIPLNFQREVLVRETLAKKYLISPYKHCPYHLAGLLTLAKKKTTLPPQGQSPSNIGWKSRLDRFTKTPGLNRQENTDLFGSTP